MHAGTGITHSEKNPGDDWLHLLQIWIIPETKNVTPSWEQRAFDMTSRAHDVLLCSPEGRDNSLKIHQNAAIRSIGIPETQTWTYTLGDKRHAWLHMVTGTITVDTKHTLSPGDSLGISNAETISITATEDARFIWFDLA
jgi:redox-sensitive bicupin YhaK (pirin superfamily)